MNYEIGLLLIAIGLEKKRAIGPENESWNLIVWNQTNQTKVGSFEFDLGFPKILFLRVSVTHTTIVLVWKFVLISIVIRKSKT